MIVSPSRRKKRAGLTLLEVIVALAIFLVSMAAISSLVNRSADLAFDSNLEMTATRLAESKLAEIMSGAEPLTGSAGTFIEEPEWNWEVMSSEQGQVPNLWSVNIRVFRIRGDGSEYEVRVSQLMLDPSVRYHPSPPIEEMLPAEDDMAAGDEAPARE